MKKFLKSSVILLTVFLAVFLSSCKKGGTQQEKTADNDFKDPLAGIAVSDGEYVLIESAKPNVFFAANFFTSENGAVGDGKADDTAAIQTTLDKASENGGGTVYIGSGTYRISDQLRIPANVTLQGYFIAPTAKDSAQGTVLLVSENERTLSDTLIVLNDNATLNGITIWYEGQTATEPKEYPYTVEQYEGASATVCNVALLNSYRGICLQSLNAQDAVLENIYISALESGIRVENNTGKVNLENISVSPIYWINDQRTGKAENFSATGLKNTVTEKLQAVSFGAVADLNLSQLSIDTAGIGIRFSIPYETDGAVSASQITVTNAGKALSFESLGKNGAAFVSSRFRTTDMLGTAIVQSAEGFSSPIVFNGCQFLGQPYHVVELAGKNYISFMNCSFSGWRDGAVHMQNGVLLATNNHFTSDNTLGVMQNPALGLFCNNVFPVQYPTADADYFFENKTEQTLSFRTAPEPNTNETVSLANKTVVSATDFAVSPENSDNAAQLQQAIDTLSQNGGGILFLPSGSYNVSETITLKENVHLYGVSSHYGKNTVTTLRTPQDVKSSKTILAASSNTSISNLALEFTGEADLNFGEGESPSAYAANIENCENVRINHVELVNAPNGIRLNGVQNAVLKNIRGTVLQYGINAQNSSGLLIKNTDFNDSYASDAEKEYRKNHSVSIHINGSGSAVLQNLATQNAYFALELDSEKITEPEPAAKITVNGLTARGVFTGINIKSSSHAAFLNTAVFPSLLNNAAYHAISAATNGGIADFYNLTGAGSITSSLLVRGGDVTVQSSILKDAGKSTFITSGGTLTVAATIFEDTPESYHIEADGGNTVFLGNLIQSAKEFGALETQYVKSYSDGGSFSDWFNTKECDIDLNSVELS